MAVEEKEATYPKRMENARENYNFDLIEVEIVIVFFFVFFFMLHFAFVIFECSIN